MKVTSTIIPPPPPVSKIQSIILTLTPREAFILATLAGNLKYDKALQACNGSSLQKDGQLTKFAGEVSYDELDNLLDIYFSIRDELYKDGK